MPCSECSGRALDSVCLSLSWLQGAGSPCVLQGGNWAGVVESHPEREKWDQHRETVRLCGMPVSQGPGGPGSPLAYLTEPWAGLGIPQGGWSSGTTDSGSRDCCWTCRAKQREKPLSSPRLPVGTSLCQDSRREATHPVSLQRRTGQR